MNFKKIKSQVIKEIGESIISEGFLYNKSREQFEQGLPGGVGSAQIQHLDYGPQIILLIWWAVRIERMAAIFNTIAEKDEEFFEGTHVFSNGLGTLIDYVDNGNRKTNADNKRYLITNEEEVPNVVAEAVGDIRKYIIPYFAQNNSVERANELLNYNPTEHPSVHNLAYPNRIMMGLIAAKLTHNPEYDRLVSIYNPEMEEVADNAKREYAKLKVLLSRM